jgi:hypothetical protein
MDVALITTRIQPTAEDESYVISAELDLSPIGLPDQTSAETVIKYVIRNIETTWQVVQRPPSSAKYVWPSMAPQNDASERFPGHPNISAIVVEASAGDRDLGSDSHTFPLPSSASTDDADSTFLR